MAQSFCWQCGHKLKPLQTVCPKCMTPVVQPAEPTQPGTDGQALPAGPPPVQGQEPAASVAGFTSEPAAVAGQELKDADTKAIIALVLGIGNFVLGFPLLFIGAIILGRHALRVYDRHGQHGGNRGLALAGLILGWIGLAGAILVVLFVVFIIVALAIDPPRPGTPLWQ